MTRIFCIFLILGTCLSGLVRANPHPGPCEFAVQAELLYLQPNVDATAFATQVLSSSSQKSLVNDPDYNPGFRIEGVYAWQCLNQLHGRFTYFNSGSNTRTVSGNFVSPTVFSGTVKDDVRFRYYAVELLFGRWLFDCAFDLELQAGLLYSNIKTTDFVTVSGPTTSTRTGRAQTKFWGVGPEVALNFKYPLPLCLALEFDGRGGLLISRTDPTVFGVDGFNLLAETFSGIVPTSDLKLGLNWVRPYRCFDLNVSAGYEWIYYHRAYIQSTLSTNITFNGPYFALGVVY